MTQVVPRASDSSTDVVVTPQRLLFADVARCAAAIAVVLQHAAARRVLYYSTVPIKAYWWAAVPDMFCRWAVPVFVMLSGALLLAPAKVESTGTFYRKRMHRIAIPFLFWVAFYLLIRKFQGEGGMTLRKAIYEIAAGTPFPHLHFLYIIIGLYLFTPMMRLFVRQASVKLVLFTGMMVLATSGLDLVVGFALTGGRKSGISHFVPYIGYYLVGYALYAMRPSSRWLIPAAVLFVATGAIAILARGLIEPASRLWARYFDDYLGLPVIVLSITVFVLFLQIASPERKPWHRMAQRLGAASFGIYLIHPAVIAVFYRLWPSLVSKPQPIDVLWLFLGALILSYVASEILLRIPGLRRVIS